MTSRAGRTISVIVIAVVVIAFAAGIAVSLFRRGARPVRPRPADVTKQDNSSGTEERLPKVEKPELPPSDYVGRAACAECHAGIAESYAKHPMANSAAAMASVPAIEDYADKTHFEPDQRHVYFVEKTDAGINHHEKFLDEDGTALFDQSVRVDYSIGSGAHGRSYLIDRQGSMYMSPISWYSKAHRWNLSPGYRLPVHKRFERRISTACLDCHVGRLNVKRGEHNHFVEPPFLEASIGCERCHGPGGEHVAFHRSGTGKGRDPIVNPSKLDPARREDVCAQCHLQGDVRIANYGCQIGDFRPGQRLEETAAIFVKGTRTADGKSKAVSHVEQTRSSTCFKKSQGKFGCTSCHNPHSMPAESEKVAFYREKCLKCHSEQGCSLPEKDRKSRQADDSCVACHMASLTASDIPHTSNTDHRILRTPSALDPNSTDDELPELFDGASQRISQVTLERARGLWLSYRAEQRTDRRVAEMAFTLLSQVVKRVPDDPDVLEGLGTASAVLGNMDQAIDFWKQAVEVDPNRDSTLRTLAITLENIRRTSEATPYIEHYLKIQPWSSSMWGRYSRIQGLQGQWEAALDSVQKAEAIDPSLARIYQWTSKVYNELGKPEESEKALKLFEKLKPPMPMPEEAPQPTSPAEL